MFWAAVFALACVVHSVSADTPASCMYEDIRGTWTFEFGPDNNDRTVDCSKSFETSKTLRVKLEYPDIATDEFNNVGHWTMANNQGFQVTIAGRTHFGFSHWVKKTSYCHLVYGGWSHDVLDRDWACFNGKKSEAVIKHNSLLTDESLTFTSKTNRTEKIAGVDRLFTGEELLNMAGGRNSQMFSAPKPAPITDEQERMRGKFPKSFDWRDVNGVNYVSPVRSQGNCGSCFAFASLAVAEARVRIQTNNTQTPVFSPQDVVECSQYSQGCAGGFPILIAGRYAEDFGLVLEECNPYKGKDGKCSTKPTCERHYTIQSSFVGGYYGGCNEVLMQQAIYERGPITVSYKVYDDFREYENGVYIHKGPNVGVNRFEPYVETTHATLAVGWGELPPEQGGTKYWIVKNSWGERWGMDGYFWIRRGTNECNIESVAVETMPIYKQMN